MFKAPRIATWISTSFCPPVKENLEIRQTAWLARFHGTLMLYICLLSAQLYLRSSADRGWLSVLVPSGDAASMEKLPFHPRVESRLMPFSYSSL